MTASIDEDTVDFKPNYDSRETEPTVLPAAIPNLLVNGATGIAVGMATNIAPHNLVEVVAGAPAPDQAPDGDPRRPDAVHPRPRPAHRRQDRRPRRRSATPTRPAAARFRMRATARVETLRPAQGHRRHRAALRRRHREGRRADQDPGPGQEAPGHRRHQGPHRPAEGPAAWSSRSRTASIPEALLEQLYRQTPMEDTFGINTVALVDGQPRTLGPQGAARGLPRATASTSSAAARCSAAARPPTGCTSSTAC